MNQYIFDVQKKGLANEQNLIWSEIQMLIFYVFRKLLTSLMQIIESFTCWREKVRKQQNIDYVWKIIEIRWHRAKKTKKTSKQKFFPRTELLVKFKEWEKYCRLLIHCDYKVYTSVYCRNGWYVFVYVVKEMCHNMLLVCCSTHHKFTFSMSICYGYRRSETEPIEWNHNNNNKWTMVGGEGQKWLSQMPTMPELKVSES